MLECKLHMKGCRKVDQHPRLLVVYNAVKTDKNVACTLNVLHST